LALLDLLIRKLERYGRFSAEERRFLEQSPWRVVDYQPDNPIVREGDSPTERCCLVFEGFAYRFKSLPVSTRQIMAFHILGDFCDLHGFSLERRWTMASRRAAHAGPDAFGRHLFPSILEPENTIVFAAPCRKALPREPLDIRPERRASEPPLPILVRR
jgi:hypothetical protein